MALDVIIEEDVFPLHTGTHVVDDPSLASAISWSGNNDSDVSFRIGKGPDDDVTRTIFNRIS